MSPPIVTDAICLTVQKFSETSKIAVLYTRLWGRISVIAKGANRPKSQYAGHLEPLSVAECVIYKKPTERLQLLSSCRATQPWLPLTTSLERAAYAFAVCEFLYRHTYEGQDGELFQLAAETLRSLAGLPDAETARQFWDSFWPHSSRLDFARFWITATVAAAAPIRTRKSFSIRPPGRSSAVSAAAMKGGPVSFLRTH